ncbi:glutathione S-transferase family protein [Roseibium sp. M-1]
MNFALHNAPQSTCSQRVRYTLHAKGLDFDEYRLDLFAGDQLRPEYLQINPNGVVPTLVHGDHVVTDSAVIMEYLDEISAAPPLVPEGPVARAQMRSMLRYIDEVPTPAIRIPSYNLAFLPHFKEMTQEEFQALADSKPLRREFLLKMGRTGFPEQEMDEALARLQRGVHRLAGWLRASGGPWIMGSQITLPDIAIMPVIVRMEDIGLDKQWLDHPEVAQWLESIKSTPAFRPTYYEGSLLTEKYPHLRSKI